MLHDDRRRAGSFGDDADQYDRARPTYPAPLVDDLLDDGTHDVLDVPDVGCGTGKVGRLFAARGCAVLGVEPDERMAAVDRAAEAAGLPGAALMESAGGATAREIRRLWPLPGRAVVLVGGGRNGGDGLVVARHLQEAGWRVELLLLADPARLKGTFRSGYINDHGDKETDLLGRPIQEERAFAEWQHQQMIAPNLSLNAQLNWWKDSEVVRDFRPRAL